MTLKDAKQFYMQYDCSAFAMAREDLPKYKEYKKLHISSLVEKKWQNEAIKKICLDIKNSKSVIAFNKLYDLSVKFRDKEKLDGLLDALKDIEDGLTYIQKVIVAETIIGRGELITRSGMIYWAYDLNRNDVALALLQKVFEYLDMQTEDDKLCERVMRDNTKCEKNAKELKIIQYT